MRRALALAGAAGIGLLALALLLTSWMRCIDTPTFYNASTLLVSCAGVVALVAGSAGWSTSRALGSALLVVGVALVAWAVAGPPFHGCDRFEMFERF